MEFPSLGANCHFDGCNLTDFLPLECKCGKIFCRVHFMEHSLSGDCELAPEPKEVNFKTDKNMFKCSDPSCKKGTLHEMLCPKCNEHYCIEHRFHPSCPEIDDETMALKIEQFEAPRRQFHEANKHLQEKITENIRKALQSSAKVKTASKIHLMRIKQKALGAKTIPTTDRVYFAIGKPKDMSEKPVRIVSNVDDVTKLETVTLDPDLKDAVPVFVSAKWSLGKAIDAICDLCYIKNDNNKISEVKLRLFRQLDGYCISPLKMDVEISELIRKEVLIEGDKLLIEYIGTEVLNSLDENDQVFLN